MRIKFGKIGNKLKIARRLLRIAKRLLAAEWHNEEPYVIPTRKDSQGNWLADEMGQYKDFTGRILYEGNNGLVSNACFTLIPDEAATVIWKSGVWNSGIWKSGRWLFDKFDKNHWRGGTWLGGFSGPNGLATAVFKSIKTC